MASVKVIESLLKNTLWSARTETELQTHRWAIIKGGARKWVHRGALTLQAAEEIILHNSLHLSKVLSLLEACFDLILSPSLSMKIQIMGGKITENTVAKQGSPEKQRKWEHWGSSGAQLQGDLLCCLDGWKAKETNRRGVKEEEAEAVVGHHQHCGHLPAVLPQYGH